MEPNKIIINIAKNYSPTPGPRYIKEGDFSGQRFRETVLYPQFKKALSEKKKIVVDLDGTAGYGTSFLEEAFGGLIRVEKIDYKTIVDNLELISFEEEYLKEDIYSYLKDAEEDAKK